VNPFDLTGPAFLVFYLALGVVVLGALIVARRVHESTEGPRVQLSDAYLIAYLRGGANEALRVATVSLIDRGLLQVGSDDLVRVTDKSAAGLVRRPIEKDLLRWFEEPREGNSVFDAAPLRRVTADLERDLRQVGLLPDEEAKRRRRARQVLAVAVLWIVALVKVLVAISRGRWNVFLLIFLSLAFAVGADLVSNRRRTARGDALLADLKTLFSGLKDRARFLHPGGATAEAALLAAVFGLAALPAAEWSYAKKLYPQAASGSGGSTCGLAGGSSCGSSCGGGCGGGCGGCGS
jgi:uncharacterized protein (TIGR04222 family)